MIPLPSFFRSAALAVTLAASCLLFAPAALADGQWYPLWTPCNADGSPIVSSPDAEGMINLGGVLTGNATGDQSMPYSAIHRYLYSPQPSQWFDGWLSGVGDKTTIYDPNADGPTNAGIDVGATNFLYPGGEADDPTSVTSHASGNVSVALVAYYRWTPYYDDGTDYPTPSAPPPPTATNFFLKTSLSAYYSNGYQATSAAPAGMLSSASASDQFGEQVQVTSPAGPYPYSGGGERKRDAMAERSHGDHCHASYPECF